MARSDRYAARWAALFVLALDPAHGQTLPPSLCQPQEQVLFSCSLKAGKVLSLCALGALAAPAARLQYRFGSPDAPEFQYPAVPGQADRFFYSATGYAGGGEARIRFSNGDYDYLLFERTVRTETKGRRIPQTSAGVMVRRSGKTLSVRLCLAGGLQADLEPHLPQEAFEYLDDLR